MNLHRPVSSFTLSDDARTGVARIQDIWAECYRRYGKEAVPVRFLWWGRRVGVAPVVHRFLRSYAIEVKGDAPSSS